MTSGKVNTATTDREFLREALAWLNTLDGGVQNDMLRLFCQNLRNHLGRDPDLPPNYIVQLKDELDRRDARLKQEIHELIRRGLWS